MLTRYKPAKIGSMRQVALTLAESNRGESVARMLDTMTTGHLRCLGFSVLACTMKNRAAEMLDRAERVVSATRITGDTDEGYALLALVRAQATNGRTTEASRTADIIRVHGHKCMALLLLNALQKSEEIPGFIIDALW